MVFVACGFNHQSAPIEIREQVAIGPEIRADILRQLTKQPAVNEAAILSTCNRTEIICETRSPSEVLPWLAAEKNISFETLRSFSYIHKHEHAVKHMMRVACGLDSKMLGEPQILGQLKDAYQYAQQTGTIGPNLHHIFQHVFSTSKRVRTDTAIGDNPISIAYAAVNYCKQIFNNLEPLVALLIGAGETNKLAAKHLQHAGVSKFLVANRTLERANELASSIGGNSITIGDIPYYMSQADIVISATACPLPFIGKGLIERSMNKRDNRTMFLLDLSMPRDIEPEVAEIENVHLYNLDNMQTTIDENLNNRRDAAKQAEHIIQSELKRYRHWQRRQSSKAAICSYRQHMQALCSTETKRALKSLAKGQNPEAIVRELSYRLLQKLAHQPTARLHQAALDGENDIIKTVMRLFSEIPQE